MPGLNCDEEVTCENCRTQATKKNIVRYKTRCSVGSHTFPSGTNFSKNSRDKMDYHVAKEHTKSTARAVQKCKICEKTFTDFTFCDKISGRNVGLGEVQELKILMLHNYDDTFMTRP